MPAKQQLSGTGKCESGPSSNASEAGGASVVTIQQANRDCHPVPSPD
jgi:hypothetical protein